MVYLVYEMGSMGSWQLGYIFASESDAKDYAGMRKNCKIESHMVQN